jgi:hypothetical protein
MGIQNSMIPTSDQSMIRRCCVRGFTVYQAANRTMNMALVEGLKKEKEEFVVMAMHSVNV